MPGNKAQTGVTEPWRQLPGTRGSSGLRAGAVAALGGSRPPPGPSPALPRTSAVSSESGEAGPSRVIHRGAAVAALRSPLAAAKPPPGAALGAGAPPSRREEARGGTGTARTDGPRPAAHPHPPTHPRAGPALRAGAGGRGGSARSPPAPQQLSAPSPAGKLARAGPGGGSGGSGRGSPRRSPTSALQKACCGWMGEQLQASAGRALPSSSTASQASRLGSAAGMVRGLRARPPGPDPAPTAGPGRAAAGNLGPAGAGALRPPLRCLRGAVRFLPAALGLAL